VQASFIEEQRPKSGHFDEHRCLERFRTHERLANAHKPIVRALKTQKREAEDVRTARVFLGPETCFAILRVKVVQYLLNMYS
jgi:hypothetical protein